MLIFHFCQHSENWRPKLWGGLVLGNFSLWLIVKEMAAIFQCFYNGQCWYCVLVNPDTEKFCRFSFPNFFIGSVFPVTHPRFHLNMNAWLCLKHFCMVTFLHSESQRRKFSVNSVFWTFPLVQFSPSPILGSYHHLCVAMHKTFMCGDLSALVKSTKKNPPK